MYLYKHSVSIICGLAENKRMNLCPMSGLSVWMSRQSVKFSSGGGGDSKITDFASFANLRFLGCGISGFLWDF